MTKERLMLSLRKLASSPYDIEDLDWMHDLDNSVKAKGSSLEEVAELDADLGKIGLNRGEVGKLVELERRLEYAHTTPAAVMAQMDLDEKLSAEGYTEPIRRRLLETSRDIGGVGKVLEALDNYAKIVNFSQMETYAENRAAEASARADQQKQIADKYDAQVQSINQCILFGWSLSGLLFAPEIVKRADTPEKRIALSKHLNQHEWYKVDEDWRLVKTGVPAFHDPIELWRTLREIRQACLAAMPFDYDKLLSFSSLIEEKLPGLTIEDYARLLLKQPDLSEPEKRFANYLIQLEGEAERNVTSDGNELRSEINILKVQCYLFSKRFEELRMSYPSSEQQKIFDGVLQLVTNTIPTGADLLGYWDIMEKIMDNLGGAAEKDETLTYEEKLVMGDLRKHSHLFDQVKRSLEGSRAHPPPPNGGPGEGG
jgi:hypothetical protein